MYRGFNLSLDGVVSPFAAHRQAGVEFMQNTWPKLKPDMAALTSGDDIDGDKVMKDWFAGVNANVFISHSHDDKDIALGLAGYLHHELQLRPFVDSLVWSNASDLLRNIDNLYCRSEDGKTYSYERRNYTTSHVHMMLAASLTEAIDRCECIIFLNTPSSIAAADAENSAEEKTASPWIYHELNTSRLIRRRELKRPRFAVKAEARDVALESASESYPTIMYPAALAHLAHIDYADVVSWADGTRIKGVQALDVLYRAHANPDLGVPPHK